MRISFQRLEPISKQKAIQMTNDDSFIMELMRFGLHPLVYRVFQKADRWNLENRLCYYTAIAEDIFYEIFLNSAYLNKHLLEIDAIIHLNKREKELCSKQITESFVMHYQNIL